MAAEYMIKPSRVDGVAVKKPKLFIRMLQSTFPVKGDSAGDVVRKLIFIVALISFLVTAGFFLKDLVGDWMAIIADQRISQFYDLDNSESPDPETGILPNFQKLLEKNKDVVGWISVPGLNIDYPVMQTPESNDFYLTHNFERSEVRSGAITADYRNVFSPDRISGNTILYGHNMYAGTHFAQLTNYYSTVAYDNSMEFYSAHPVIQFDTLYEKSTWKIFAVDLFNVEEQYGEVYDYIGKRDFSSKEEFNQYIIDIMDRSNIYTDVDFEYGDEILTLSTCYWPYSRDMDNVRLVVFARKVREGESASVNTDLAVRNNNPMYWEWVYDSYGWSWPGSTWDRRKLLSYTEEDAATDGYTYPSE